MFCIVAILSSIDNMQQFPPPPQWSPPFWNWQISPFWKVSVGNNCPVVLRPRCLFIWGDWSLQIYWKYSGPSLVGRGRGFINPCFPLDSWYNRWKQCHAMLSVGVPKFHVKARSFYHGPLCQATAHNPALRFIPASGSRNELRLYCTSAPNNFHQNCRF